MMQGRVVIELVWVCERTDVEGCVDGYGWW
jgi:hypothetical protein